MVDAISILIGLMMGMFTSLISTEVFGIGKNKGIKTLIRAIKKRQIIGFLETETLNYMIPIVKVFKNLGITENRDIVVITKGSIKQCPQLGAFIVHGDLYKSLTCPQEVRKFVVERQQNGWKNEDIAQFLEEIETTPAQGLEQYYEFLSKENIKKANGETENAQIEISKQPNFIQKLMGNKKITELQRDKYRIFIGLPSIVKDFVYSGINRTMIKTQMRELVFQNDLNKINQKNWMPILLGVGIMVLLIFFGFKFLLGDPEAANVLTNMISPQTVNPGGI